MGQSVRECVAEIADTRKGRPVQMGQEIREALILDAAETLLVEDGLKRTSMDAIARRAGMSKRTIYELFDNRDQLLCACIEQKCRAFLRPLETEMKRWPLDDRLRMLLCIKSAPTYEEASLELLRAIIAEARNYPWLAKATHQGGLLALQKLVSEELCSAIRCGEIAMSTDCATRAASMLVSMVFENPVAILLDRETFPSEAERTARRDMAVEIFLKGLGWEAPDTEPAHSGTNETRK